MKWLRFRLFRLGPFSLKHFTGLDSFLQSFSLSPSEEIEIKKMVIRFSTKTRQ